MTTAGETGAGEHRGTGQMTAAGETGAGATAKTIFSTNYRTKAPSDRKSHSELAKDAFIVKVS